MTCLVKLLAGLLVMSVLVTARAETPVAVRPNSQQIEKLVEQLASPRFAERERARQQLRQIGEPALEALRRALQSPDAEQRRRAAELVQEIESKQLQKRLLAPKRVRLDLENRSVAEAVQELARQSGYPVQLVDPQNNLSQRRITLHTGEVSFWEALDQLCQKAGLVEEFSPGVPPGVRPLPVVPAIPRVRIQPLPAPLKPVPLPPAPNAGRPDGPAVPGAPGPGGPPTTPVPAPAQPGKQVPQQPKEVKEEPTPQSPLPALPQAGHAVAPHVKVMVQVAQQVGRARVIAPYLRNSGTTLTLKPGTPSTAPTCYAGAVRIRVLSLPTGGRPASGERQILLEVLAEPHVQLLTTSGTPHIHRAVDDQGQSWTPVPNDTPSGGESRPVVFDRMANTFIRLLVNVRLQVPANASAAKTLKELAGTIPLQVLGPSEPLIQVDRPQQAVGKTFQGADGASLEVVTFRKLDNGDYQVELRMRNLPGGANQMVIQQVVPLPGGGQPQVQIVTYSGGSPHLPVLRDAQGRSYQVVQVSRHFTAVVNGNHQQGMVLVFRPQPGQGEPASLALEVQRPVTLSVPFRLENIPLR